jgi:hypothetical protein
MNRASRDSGVVGSKRFFWALVALHVDAQGEKQGRSSFCEQKEAKKLHDGASRQKFHAGASRLGGFGDPALSARPRLQGE